MTEHQLTAILATRVMGWKVCPDRFRMEGRGWVSHWRFQPIQRIADADRLLDEASVEEYSMTTAEGGGYRAKVRIAGTTGEACEPSKARAISFAVARAIGVEPEVEG